MTSEPLGPTSESAIPIDPAAHAAAALEIVREMRYVVLATSDAEGLPWASPVYYAHRGLDEFIWVSRPISTHSRNIDARAEIGLVVFDSRVAVGAGRGVYARATAEVVPDADVDAAVATFSERSVLDGAGEWDTARMAETGLRLYRATTTEVSLLPGGGPDFRVPIK
jgi:nitroimidazol reductase NimA-like FMN-containing flavoprotein (pyridoxamine 5'-phosphate oxidase superfamily)